RAVRWGYSGGGGAAGDGWPRADGPGTDPRGDVRERRGTAPGSATRSDGAATLSLGRPSFRTEARRRTRRGRPRRDERSANGADGAGNARAGEAGAGDAVWDHLKRGTRNSNKGSLAARNWH